MYVCTSIIYTYVYIYICIYIILYIGLPLGFHKTFLLRGFQPFQEPCAEIHPAMIPQRLQIVFRKHRETQNAQSRRCRRIESFLECFTKTQKIQYAAICPNQHFGEPKESWKRLLWHRVTLEHNGSNPYTSHGSNSQLQKLHALGKHNVCNSVKGWIFDQWKLGNPNGWDAHPPCFGGNHHRCSRWSRVSLPAIGRSSGFSCQIPLDFSWWTSFWRWEKKNIFG